jgi:hypothetical protein
MPGDSGVTVVTTTGEHFYPFLPTRLRAHRAPGIPCALCEEGRKFLAKPCARMRRDRETMPNCHHPRRRVIQYSRNVSNESRSRGVLDAPPSRGMTTVVWSGRAPYSSVVPAKAGTHNHRKWGCAKSLHSVFQNRRHGVWVPAFAGTTANAHTREVRAFAKTKNPARRGRPDGALMSESPLQAFRTQS